MPADTSHGERISAVESQVKTLAANLSELASIVRTSHDNLSRDIRDVSQQIAKRGEVNWAVWIGAVGLILAIGTAALSPIWIRIGAVEGVSNTNRGGLVDHEKEPVHPVAAERLKGLEERIVLLRELSLSKLQRVEEQASLERARIEQNSESNLKRAIDMADLQHKHMLTMDEYRHNANAERITALEKLLQPIPKLEQKVEVLETKIRDSKPLPDAR